jgi:hypothetical protein
MRSGRGHRPWSRSPDGGRRARCPAALRDRRGARGRRDRMSSSSSSSIGLPGGAKILSETDVPVCATGQVEVSFSSDAVAQCGCGYIGTDSWQPQGGGDLDVLAYRKHGRREFDTTLLLGGSNSVRDAVARMQATGQTTACSDTTAPEDGDFISPPVHAGRLVVSLAQSGASLITSRCAGPLPVDVSARAADRFDQRAPDHPRRRRPRSPGQPLVRRSGFSGVVRSTLVRRLGRARLTLHRTRFRRRRPRGTVSRSGRSRSRIASSTCREVPSRTCAPCRTPASVVRSMPAA